MNDLLGQQLGNYRLTRLLGKGGFASVYLGEHCTLTIQAAIKVLHAQLISSDIDSFHDEARTISRLEHPHILRVLDFAVEDSIPFLVMEYAPNGTLRTHHAKGIPLPLDTIISYVKQLAAALQYAHNKKLIHRDVKPENILLGANNDILLSDFGLAMIVQSSYKHQDQSVAGTVPYMAPEQIRGVPCPASDQYALGVITYEWLCGERPFRGSLLEVASQHIHASPPSLCEKIPTISPAVEQVVLRALEKDPDRRFSTVHAFAQALEEVSSVEYSLPTSPTMLLAASATSADVFTPPADTFATEPVASSLPDDRALKTTSRSILIEHLLPKQSSRMNSLLQECVLILSISICFSVCARVLFLVGVTLVITLWTLGVLLIGATLGSRRAGLTLLVYLVEGAIGLPVFANLESGGAHLKVLAGSQLFFTEGIAGLDYLIRHSASIGLSFPLLACWSFPIAAYVTGWLFERLGKGNFSKAALAMLPGAFIIHAIPVGWSIWLSLIKHLSLATIIASIQLTWPFTLGELIQAVLAAGILSIAWKLLRIEGRKDHLEHAHKRQV